MSEEYNKIDSLIENNTAALDDIKQSLEIEQSNKEAQTKLILKTLEELIKNNIEVLNDVKVLLQSNKKPAFDQIENQSKEYIINFMLEHMNIPFIRDDIEKEIYNAILDIIFKVIEKVV